MFVAVDLCAMRGAHAVKPPVSFSPSEEAKARAVASEKEHLVFAFDLLQIRGGQY